jgi:two-component system cell cycle sensor histidine kinase/response regulator CckA
LVGAPGLISVTTHARKKVLVLEDEPALMKLLRYALSQYDLIEATTADEAIHLFGERRRNVDLLISDVTLPVGSGLRVASLLRSEIRNLPVILTSGYPVSSWSVRDTVDLQRLGSNSVAFIQKPFQARELLRLVEKLLGVSPAEDAKAHGKN